MAAFAAPAPAPFAAPAGDVDDGVKTYRYPSMSKTRDGFTLNVVGAEFTSSQIILLRGQPHTGKTTFISILARHVYPDTIQGKFPDLHVSSKPQRIRRNNLSVRDLFRAHDYGSFRDRLFVSSVIKPLQILPLMDQMVANLSAAQLQRLALCLCLTRDADVYLIDEPTARLDHVERSAVSQVIKRFMQHTKRTAFVIEHNLEVASYLADRVIVFEGVPYVDCVANPPIDLNEYILI